jgi:hypothetical protein
LPLGHEVDGVLGDAEGLVGVGGEVADAVGHGAGEREPGGASAGGEVGAGDGGGGAEGADLGVEKDGVGRVGGVGGEVGDQGRRGRAGHRGGLAFERREEFAEPGVGEEFVGLHVGVHRVADEADRVFGAKGGGELDRAELLVGLV